MDEIIDALDPFGGGHPKDGALTEAAKKWACYALDNLVGKRLEMALTISRALAEYDALE